MSGAASCREIRHSLGVYVLGAIDPADRAQVDEHLATCTDCREELASLAGLPALLRRVPTAEAERLAVADQADLAGPAELVTDETSADEMLPSLLTRTTRARRVRRWRELAAAAAVAVLALGAGAAGATALSSGSSPSGTHAQAGAKHTWQTVSGIDSVTGATLTVKYASVPWGTTMAVRVSGIPAGTVCEFVVTDTHGHRFVVGGWRVNYRGWPVWYPASTSLPDAGLGSFQVTADGKVMASVSAA
jgi:predicted anti-sigma-YlaC factor YlaD